MLQPGLHFYTRFFDVFQSPDELLANNFTEKEIYEIKSDPFYFKFSGKDFVTMLPAPTIQPLPRETPFNIVTFDAIQTSFPIKTGATELH